MTLWLPLKMWLSTDVVRTQKTTTRLGVPCVPLQVCYTVLSGNMSVGQCY